MNYVFIINIFTLDNDTLYNTQYLGHLLIQWRVYMLGNMSEAHVSALSSKQILHWATNAPGLGLLAASIKTRDVIYEDNYLAIISMYKLKIYLS